MKKFILSMVALLMISVSALAGNNMKVTNGSIKNLKQKGTCVVKLDFSAINEQELNQILIAMGSNVKNMKAESYKEFTKSWNKETKGIKIINEAAPKDEKGDFTMVVKVKKFNEATGYNPWMGITYACDVDAEVEVKDASGNVVFDAYTKKSVRADGMVRRANIYWDAMGKHADEICDLF